jgi:uncharacterized protein YbjT (DUF2867 family)
MSAGKKIAVAGATGRVGQHVVDVLTERGHDVVPMSRGHGVDVTTGEGLADALAGVECIVDTVTGPWREQQAATEFFTTAARNLQEAGRRAGVQRIVVVSIIGTDRLKGDYGVAKVAHEQATLSGPIPARVLRAAQFHEFVEQLLQWGTQGDVSYVPKMRTQLVAARTVAEALAELAVDPGSAPGPTVEVAGPREESLVEMAKLLVARRGNSLWVEAVSDPVDGEANESGVLLPGPDARLGGPTFEESGRGQSLNSTSRSRADRSGRSFPSRRPRSHRTEGVPGYPAGSRNGRPPSARIDLPRTPASLWRSRGERRPARRACCSSNPGPSGTGQACSRSSGRKPARSRATCRARVTGVGRPLVAVSVSALCASCSSSAAAGWHGGSATRRGWRIVVTRSCVRSSPAAATGTRCQSTGRCRGGCRPGSRWV